MVMKKIQSFNGEEYAYFMAYKKTPLRHDYVAKELSRHTSVLIQRVLLKSTYLLKL